MSKKGSMAKKEAKKEKGASKMPPFNITEHKPMEEEMRKLSSAIEQSIDGVAIADLEPKLTYVNDAFARMHGYSREEMIGMKVVNLHNEEQMDEYKRSMNQTKTQGSWEGEIGHISKDGTPFTTYMSVTLLKGDDGKPRGIAAVTTDITEHKPTEEAPGQDQTELERQVEETLKDSEPKFKTIVENIRDVVFQLSPLGMIQYVSPKVQEVYGYKPEDLVGKHLKKTTPVRELPKAMKILKSALSGKAINNLEINQRDAKGKIIPMEINAAPVRKEGKIIAVQGIMRDITKRKRAEEELRESEARNRSLVNAGEHMGEAIFLLQDTDKVEAAHLFANEEWTRITGYTTEELRGTSYYDVIHPRHRAAVADRVRRRLQQGQDLPGRWEISVIAKDGTEVPIEVGGGGPITYHGKLATVGYARDITERKRMEEELRKAHDELEMRVEERTEELVKTNEVLQAEITERKRAEEALKDSGERYRSLVNNVELGILRSTPGPPGRFLEVNPAMEEITGYSRKELLKMDISDLYVYPEEREALIQELASTRGKVVKELHWRKKDGTEIVLADTKVAVRDDDGRILYLDGVMEDITERKRAEEQLIRLSNAVKMSTDSIVISDLESKIIDVNEATLRMYGADDKRDLIGKNSLELIAPEEREKALEGMREVLAKGYVKGLEYHIITKEGSKILVEMSVAIMRDADGKPIGFVGVSRDITERKRAEEALRESEKEKSSLVEESPIAICNVNLTGKITFVNRRFEEESGYSREEVVGKNAFKMNWLPEATLKYFMQRMGSRLRGEPAKHWETQFKCKDGRWIWIDQEGKVIKKLGVPVGFQIVATNITERKKTEDALMESKERFRIASQIASDVVYERDLQTGIATFYGDIESHLGYEPGGYPRTLEGWREHVHPEDLARIESQPMDQIQPGVPYGVEYRMRKKDGTYMTWSDRIMMVWDEKAGKPLKFIGAATDITKRKRAEEELRRMQEQLVRSERLAAIGQLAGGVGHELRNPLGAIKNAAYYVKGKVSKSELVQKEPRVMEFLDIMEDEINTSNKIISDLLGFSRVGKPSVSPTQIKDVIEDALSPTTIPESIKLIKKLDTELPQIEIDTSQIQQVLVNIITNAVQAMPEGGKLTIAAREKESFLEVEIADTGCGIPKEAVGKIFDPLFTTKAKGIGLGLAVCKTIIDRHEGNIAVKSQAGKGTTFTISLPLKRE